MSFEDDTPEVLVQDELASLKARADLMGVTYHPSIGIEKLRDKIAAALADKPEPKDEPVAPAVAADPVTTAQPEEESVAQRRLRKKREAFELVRIRVTCMNPAKREWTGEIFTVGNSLVGSVTKFVPFNIEDGWHVPRVVLQVMQDRMCQIFVNAKTVNGITKREGKLIKEFAIEVLPNLSEAELHELAQRQAMAHSID